MDIVRALISHPKLDFANEPIGSLDPTILNEIVDILKEINLLKCIAMNIITHDIEVAKMTYYVIKVKDDILCK